MSKQLDEQYFHKKLSLLLHDLSNYTPEELSRELARLSATANPAGTVADQSFNPSYVKKLQTELLAANTKARLLSAMNTMVRQMNHLHHAKIKISAEKWEEAHQLSCKVNAAFHEDLPISDSDMRYSIKLPFVRSAPVDTLVKLMQKEYDRSGISGYFNFKKMPQGLIEIVFSRYADEDGEYILEGIPNGDEVNDESLAASACNHLLKELMKYDIAPQLVPIVDALRDGKFVIEGVELLRPQVISWKN